MQTLFIATFNLNVNLRKSYIEKINQKSNKVERRI